MSTPVPAATPAYLTLAALLVRQSEGCILHPYLDSVGIPTIGIGCTRLNGVPVTMATPAITMDQAVAACEFELGRSDAVLTRYVTVPLTDWQRAALISFVYNVGTGGKGVKDGFVTLKDGRQSGILTRLLARDYAGAAAQFPLWNLASGVVSKGLVTRRALERSVFEGKAVLLAGAVMQAGAHAAPVPAKPGSAPTPALRKPVVQVVLRPEDVSADDLNGRVLDALQG